MKKGTNKHIQIRFDSVTIFFIVTRSILILLALFFIGFSGTDRTISLSKALSQWDGKWYTQIATEGYHWSGPTHQANVAFFPLYPLLAKGLSFIIGNLEFSFFLVSHISFYFFLVFLMRIAKLYLNKEDSDRTIWYVAIFPLSFVFSLFYSESLFMMLCAGSIYFAYKKNWNSSVIFALLSVLTRLAGIVLLPTLLYYYLNSTRRYTLQTVLKILCIPIGLILFCVYLNYKVGDPFAFYHVLTSWHIVYQNPFLTVLSVFSLLSKIHSYNYFSALGAFDLITLSFFFILLMLSYKRLPRELFLFSFLIFLLNIFKSWDPTFFYPMGSVNRYLFEAFPLFLTLAKLGKNKIFDSSYTTFALLLLGILSLAFYSGKWVF